MLRTFALLLLGLLFAIGGGHTDVADGLGSLTAAQVGADDCCPDRPDEPGETEPAGDCCDFDFGLCCVSGVLALVPTGPDVQGLRPVADREHGHLAPHLMHPQTTGPPPTPPPIG